MRFTLSAKRGTSAARWGIGKTSILALALAGGAYLMALAMEPPQRVWLGWVTLLPLFYAIRVLSPARAFVAGAFWGACLFVSSVVFANTAIAPTFASLVLLALIPAVYAYLGAALTQRIGFSPYLMALGWIGVEFALRPLGLHYGLLAGTQGDGFVIRIVGSFAGYVLVAFLVALVNATLVSVLSEVRLSLSIPRLVPKAGAAERRFLFTELPSYLLHLIRAAQPRAPPA
jgi:apolipoprotein N-acyltransferase